MSYAWNELRLAVHCLAEAGAQRERLTAAIAGHLSCIRPKDLPLALRQEFASVIDRLCLGRVLEQDASVRRMAEALDDKEVNTMIGTILHLYDAVTRYQPI
jgi:hypothetical protein